MRFHYFNKHEMECLVDTANSHWRIEMVVPSQNGKVLDAMVTYLWVGNSPGIALHVPKPKHQAQSMYAKMMKDIRANKQDIRVSLYA